MRQSDFIAQLKWIKREILALKQAHKYGLGRSDFFRGTVENSFSVGSHNIQATIRYQSIQNGIPYILALTSGWEIEKVEQDGINTVTMTGATSNFESESSALLTLISSLEPMAISLEEI